MPSPYAFTPSQPNSRLPGTGIDDGEDENLGISIGEIFSHKSPIAMLPILMIAYTLIAQVYIWTRSFLQ